MDEFERRLATHRAMEGLSPEEIHEAMGIPPGTGGFFEMTNAEHRFPWDDASLDTSNDLPEIDRLAEQLAERLASGPPAGTSVWARHGVVVMESGAMSESWTDLNQIHRGGIEPADLVRIAL